MEPKCTFCDRPQFEERLIAETANFNIIATFGQITDGGYVLLAPKPHILCCAEMGELAAEWLELTERICRVVELEYRSPVTVFEHGIVGQTIGHAHLHFLPAVLDCTPRVARDFPKATIQQLDRLGELAKFYQERREPYLFWYRPDKSGLFWAPMVCWNPPAPRQYLRTVAAELLGRPERANWREMDPELDRGLWSSTLERLKRHFC